MSEENTTPIKKWGALNFEVIEKKNVIGLIFPTEEDALLGILELQEWETLELKITEDENSVWFHVIGTLPINSSKQKIIRAKISYDKKLKTHPSYQSFLDLLSESEMPYFGFLFLKDGKTWFVPRDGIALIQLTQYSFE